MLGLLGPDHNTLYEIPNRLSRNAMWIAEVEEGQNRGVNVVGVKVEARPLKVILTIEVLATPNHTQRIWENISCQMMIVVKVLSLI